MFVKNKLFYAVLRLALCRRRNDDGGLQHERPDDVFVSMRKTGWKTQLTEESALAQPRTRTTSREVRIPERCGQRLGLHACEFGCGLQATGTQQAQQSCDKHSPTCIAHLPFPSTCSHMRRFADESTPVQSEYDAGDMKHLSGRRINLLGNALLRDDVCQFPPEHTPSAT